MNPITPSVALAQKAWISFEGKRNRTNAMLYAALITKAYGTEFEMFIGHHLAYKPQASAIVTLDEIPSADTLLFDHEIMRANFGPRYIEVMQQLVAQPCEERERLLERLLQSGMTGGVPAVCPFQIVQS